MRGKSIDSEFVSSFIQECASKGKTSPEEVCEEVLSRMVEIDRQLKYRIKLSDVLSFFNYKKKPSLQEKSKEISTEVEIIDQILAEEILDFMHLCDLHYSSSGITINGLMDYLSKDENHKNALTFTFKQLLKNHTITMSSDGDLSFGPNYLHK